MLVKLSRPLPKGRAVHLYATNLEVDMHNHDCLASMDGDMEVFHAEDTGTVKYISYSIFYKKKLCTIHISITLICFRNISTPILYYILKCFSMLLSKEYNFFS